MIIDYNLFLNSALVIYFISTLAFVLGIITGRRSPKIIGEVLFIIGIFAAAGTFALRWKVTGHIPLSNTFESLLLFVLLIPVIYLFLWKKDEKRLLAAASSLFIVLVIALASLIDDSVRPLVPALQSNWLTIHVLFCFIAYAVFAFSFIAAILHLIFQKTSSINFDDVTYKNILFGFPFLALGIISGAVWANQAWGTYWSWDPKETWSLITWLIYAVYLHTRYIKGWKGNKSCWLAVLGFLFVIFTYFGVNYVLSGLHSYN